METSYYDAPEGTDKINVVSWRRRTMTYRKEIPKPTLYHGDVVLWRNGKKYQSQRCIMETSYYDVPEGNDKFNVISWRRRTMTYRTKLTLYHGDVVLWRNGRKYQNQRCIMETSYYDVTERNTKANVVSWRRRTMTYRKEMTNSTLYHGDVVLWRTGRKEKEQNQRCIMETSYFDVPDWTDKSNVVSWIRRTMTYWKEIPKPTLYHGDVVLWRTGRKWQNQHYIMEDTSYYDVTEQNTKANVVSWRRRTMAYRKQMTNSTLYHRDVVLWRTGSK